MIAIKEVSVYDMLTNLIIDQAFDKTELATMLHSSCCELNQILNDRYEQAVMISDETMIRLTRLYERFNALIE